MQFGSIVPGECGSHWEWLAVGYTKFHDLHIIFGENFPSHHCRGSWCNRICNWNNRSAAAAIWFRNLSELWTSKCYSSSITTSLADQENYFPIQIFHFSRCPHQFQHIKLLRSYILHTIILIVLLSFIIYKLHIPRIDLSHLARMWAMMASKLQCQFGLWKTIAKT